jgi:uncharacterized protein
VTADGVSPWAAADALAGLSREALAAVLAVRPPVLILLVGCGTQLIQIPPPRRAELRAAGLVVDAMDTGAACRTYNVLRAEARPVAAALIAVE